VFVFTLGLTEIWESIEDETAYPTAPGTVCGEFDPARYRFRNLTWPEVAKDLTLLFRRLMQINPRFKMILTVSPVPMVATATNEHVLVANMYSKSTLRAAAAELATRRANVTYFPCWMVLKTKRCGSCSCSKRCCRFAGGSVQTWAMAKSATATWRTAARWPFMSKTARSFG
jgi:hypothetical protein